MANGEERGEGEDRVVVITVGSGNHSGRPVYFEWGVGDGIGGGCGGRVHVGWQQHNNKGVGIGGRQSMAPFAETTSPCIFYC
jgi:hypothetical protein